MPTRVFVARCRGSLIGSIFPLLLAFAPGIRGQPLELEKAIPLAGVSGRIDHLALDPAGHRLFVAALGNNTVEVVDLASGHRSKTLSGFDEPQGIAYVPTPNRLFIANGGDGTVRVLDAKSYAPIASIPLGDDADNVRYDSTAGRIYVGYGDGAIAAINATSNRAVGQIPLPAHPESFQLEPEGVRLFVNVPQSHQLWVLDRQAEKPVVARALQYAGGNFPMAFDGPNHRLFIGCRSPARLVVVNTDNSYETAKADLHGDCDDLFYDSARQRVYASCGEGHVDLFDAKPGADPKSLGSVATVHGARTSFFDGERLYLAVPKHGSTDAEIRVYAVR